MSRVYVTRYKSITSRARQKLVYRVARETSASSRIKSTGCTSVTWQKSPGGSADRLGDPGDRVGDPGDGLDTQRTSRRSWRRLGEVFSSLC